MTIPQPEGIRTQLAGSIGLSTNLLWLPISALLALSFFGILKALNSLVANPIANLARRALEGEPDDFTKQKSSSLDEEAILKRFVAKQTQRVTDIEGLFDNLEKALAQANEQVGNLSSLSERQARDLERFEQSRMLHRTQQHQQQQQ